MASYTTIIGVDILILGFQYHQDVDHNLQISTDHIYTLIYI